MKFAEYQKYSNIKIAIGLMIIFFTGFAYFYPKPFPENYYIILISVIGYGISSSLYWFVEKKLIKDMFYYGSNVEYCSLYRKGKRFKIKEMKINSEVKDRTYVYNIWFDFITLEGHKFKSPVKTIDCTTVCDERGYMIKDNIVKAFTQLFHESLKVVE